MQSLVISLFFLWAVTANLLPVLIPHLKKAGQLSTMEASLIDSAYWIAYFLVAIPAGLVMKRFGYKTAIISGLIMAAFGALLFPFAADARSFPFFLLALFIVAAGMTFLETAANPFMTIIGNPETASKRLNFAQAFNGLGAVVATVFLIHLIMPNSQSRSDAQLAAMSSAETETYYHSLFESLKLPYAGIGIVLLIVAGLFFFTRFPEPEIKAERKSSAGKFSFSRYPNLSFGIAAQFFYVGAQVCISSFFMLYATKNNILSEQDAKYCLGGLLVAFMLGRYAGTFIMTYIKPARLLTIYSAVCLTCMVYIVFIGGMGAVFAFIVLQFFMSIMYPTIFSLAIKGLGQQTELASSFMVMAILGGAIFPPLLGWVSDHSGSTQFAYIIPLICFIPVGYYGWREQQREAGEAMIRVV